LKRACPSSITIWLNTRWVIPVNLKDQGRERETHFEARAGKTFCRLICFIVPSVVLVRPSANGFAAPVVEMLAG